MAYRSIVVGTDGSATASVAVDVAIRLARRAHADLALVGALDAYGLDRRELQRALFSAAENAAGKKVEAAVVIEEKNPVEAILSCAEERDADLIVVGNRGMGVATRVRLGSVADWIAHEAPSDLLIVDTTERGGPRGPVPPYKSILAGTDGSPTATEAVRKAFTLASMYASIVTLVHVGDPIVGAIHLEAAASGRPDDVEVETRALQGDPAEQIREAVEHGHADLVVVGNKGMRGVRRMLGSVPNQVAHAVPADVLVVKTVDRSVEDIAPGHGAVVDVAGKRLAVFRDDDGVTHALSARCTHMGCTVDWNDAAKTWDCPCHGSRYAVDGVVVRGPAGRPLESP